MFRSNLFLTKLSWISPREIAYGKLIRNPSPGARARCLKMGNLICPASWVRWKSVRECAICDIVQRERLDSRTKARSRGISVENESIVHKAVWSWQIDWKSYILRFFKDVIRVRSWASFVPWLFAPMEEKTGSQLLLFSRKSDDRQKWEGLCKRTDETFKRLTDPRICSLHLKETDIAISICGRKSTPSGCYASISLTLQTRRV